MFVAHPCAWSILAVMILDDLDMPAGQIVRDRMSLGRIPEINLLHGKYRYKEKVWISAEIACNLYGHGLPVGWRV